MRVGMARSKVGVALLMCLAFSVFLGLGTWSEKAVAKNNKTAYRGNVKTKKFHAQSCRYFNCKNCTRKFATPKKAKKAGFKPCKVCKP